MGRNNGSFLVLATLCFVCSGLALSCGDGDEPKGACEQLAARVCQKACECVPASAADNDCCMGSSTGDTRCYSRNMCTVAYTRDLCGDSTKTAALFSSCSEAFGQTQCNASGSDKFAGMPAVCDELLECKAGPCLN
jgi:hypothetical protein